MSTEIEIQEGCRLLNLCGTRIIGGPDDFKIGIWRDLDGSEVRRTFENIQQNEYPVIYLNGDDIPSTYKVRLCLARHLSGSFRHWQCRATTMQNAQRAKQCA